jgi:cysteine desulfurase
MLSRYFDNAATTPCDSRVIEAMTRFLQDEPGNPDSIHAFGIKARTAVERARAQVASLIGAEDPTQVFFTSGATEANNWALYQTSEGWMSPFEHSSVREPGHAKGLKVLSNQGYGLTFPEDKSFVSCMAVCNENGAILPYGQGKGVQHCDATQAIGKIPFSVGEIDYVTLSGHKLYSPKGVGILYVREPRTLKPLLYGGGQEQGFRAGTSNVAGIVGLGMAAKIAEQEREIDFAHATQFRQIVVEEVAKLDGVIVHGGDSYSPFILSMSFEDIEGESLVLELDAKGFAISSGAACSSRKTDPSAVLLALKVPKEFLRGTIRISFGRFNCEESINDLAKLLCSEVARLRNLRNPQIYATYSQF